MRWVAAMGLVAIYLFGAVVLVSGTAGPAEAKKKVNTSNQKPSTQQNFGKGNRQGHHGHRHHGRGGGGIGIGGFGLGDGINIYIGR